MLKTFQQFINEFNKHDIYDIFQQDDTFTVSYEVELETTDISITSIVEKDDALREKLYEDLKKLLISKGLSEYDAEDIVQCVPDWDFHQDTADMLKDTISDKKIRSVVKKFYKENCIREDTIFEAMKVKLIEVLPNYWAKWGEKMVIVKDPSLTLGLEFKHELYVIGLTKGLEMWNDFYDDYMKQDVFKFKETTGLHINIGILNNHKWNFCKGFIYVKDEKINNYVFKGIEDRIKNRFCGSYRPDIKKMIKKKDISELQSAEKFINFELYNIVKSDYDKAYKNYGLNFKYLTERNYMEYRYVGGEISREVVIEKTKYFAYITYLMMDEDYKKMDYYKKLYKYIDEIS